MIKIKRRICKDDQIIGIHILIAIQIAFQRLNDGCHADDRLVKMRRALWVADIEAQ